MLKLERNIMRDHGPFDTGEFHRNLLERFCGNPGDCG